MKLRFFPTFLLIFVLSRSIASAQAVAPPPPNSTDAITSQEIYYHIAWLASDALQGRGTGTNGNEAAAAYIAREFARYGLAPAGENGTYFQTFDVVTGVEVGKGNKLNITREGKTSSFETGISFTPLTFSKTAEAKGELVFLGFGITDTSRHYNDYSDVSVKDRIAFILADDPEADNTANRENMRRFGLRQRVLFAREAGAKAVIFVDPDSDELPKLRYDNSPSNAGIPVFFITSSAAEKLFSSRNRTLKETVSEMQKTKKPASFVFQNVQTDVSSEVNFIHKKVKNVLGYLEGTDNAAKKNYYVVGGHFDHLGMGQDGSLYSGSTPAIHHGADDNASGTAGVLELAQFYAKNPPRHSMLFIGMNGEEMGLLGSSWWTNHPTKPLENVAAMYNLDMIGRLNDSTKRLNVQGTGTSPEWDKIVKEANKTYKLDLALIPEGEGASDHASFYMKDIPILFFFTGLHTDYHRPSDTIEKINTEGEKDVVKYIADVIKLSDAKDGKITFSKVKEDEASKKNRASYNVYVGTIPDFGSTDEGFKISGTNPGSPADKGGLKNGDIIIQFGQTKIMNIYDYMNALSLHKPEEDIPVKVKRGSEIVVLTVHVTKKK